MSDRASTLQPSDSALSTTCDVLLLDLDGVVYLGDDRVPEAGPTLAAMRAAGIRIGFVTNNAFRPPEAVAAALVAMGIEATTAEVVTAPQAAADVLADQLPPGAAVLVVGGPGIVEALIARGLRPVRSAGDSPAAVLQGWAPDVDWHALAEATVAINGGARWMTTNLDRTLPSPRGPLPGNGSMVAALAAATGATPTSAGKPEKALFTSALDRLGGGRALMVGDRLETDIAGARAAGLPSLLVLTGVSTAADLVAAGPDLRPDYLGRSIAALSMAHPPTEYDGTAARCGDRVATVDTDGCVRIGHVGGTATEDRLDGVRALAGLVWSKEIPPSAYLTALDTLDLD